jgi:hypothetical protein
MLIEVGNVRNELLACLRFAIEAGAGIIVPGITLRSTTDLLSISTQDIAPLSYMFDTELFTTRLRAACPQMEIWPSVDDLPYPVRNLPMKDPESLNSQTTMKKVMQYPDEWLKGFETWLDSYGPTNGVLTMAPLLASLAY